MITISSGFVKGSSAAPGESYFMRQSGFGGG